MIEGPFGVSGYTERGRVSPGNFIKTVKSVTDTKQSTRKTTATLTHKPSHKEPKMTKGITPKHKKTISQKTKGKKNP